MAGVAHYPCNYLGEEKRSQPVSNGKVMVKKKRKKKPSIPYMKRSMASGHIKPNISLLHELFAAIFFTFCEQLFQQPEPAVPSPSHFVTSFTNQAKTCIQKF